MTTRILGIHPIEADEPCHLIELEIPEEDSFDWDNVTQETPGEPRDNWQVPYDEQQLSPGRWAFFFHYLDFARPLLVAGAALTLPPPTPLPVHLRHIQYDPP